MGPTKVNVTWDTPQNGNTGPTNYTVLVTKQKLTGCDSNGDVSWVEVEGEGHSWNALSTVGLCGIATRGLSNQRYVIQSLQYRVNLCGRGEGPVSFHVVLQVGTLHTKCTPNNFHIQGSSRLQLPFLRVMVWDTCSELAGCKFGFQKVVCARRGGSPMSPLFVLLVYLSQNEIFCFLQKYSTIKLSGILDFWAQDLLFDSAVEYFVWEIRQLKSTNCVCRKLLNKTQINLLKGSTRRERRLTI